MVLHKLLLTGIYEDGMLRLLNVQYIDINGIISDIVGSLWEGFFQTASTIS